MTGDQASTPIRRSRAKGNYLCFTANTARSTVKLVAVADVTGGVFYTRTSGSSWQSYTPGTRITLANAGDKVYFWNTSSTLSKDLDNRYQFSMTGSISASGDISSMINFAQVSSHCYFSMFKDCTSLTAAPALPAETLAEGCYNHMFYGCTSLTAAPALPAETLVDDCYNSMFWGCTGIKSLAVSFTDWGPTAAAWSWVAYCSNTSDFTFTCPSGLDTDTKDYSHVLPNWTINKV